MQHYLVDGYSILFAWEEFVPLRKKNMSLARQELIRQLTVFQDACHCKVTVVFDGRSLPKSGEAIRSNLEIIYSKKGETADSIIERIVGQSPQPERYLVATNDHAEMNLVESLNARSLSADLFHSIVQDELKKVSDEIQRIRSGNKHFPRTR